MYSVPVRWNPAVAPRGVGRVEVWSRSEQVATVDTANVLGGSVTDDYVTGQRRSLSLTVEPSAQWLRWAKLPGLEIRVFSGFSWGRSEFVCPMGRFPVLPPATSLPRAAVTFQGGDWWSWLAAAEHKPAVPAYGGPIRAVLRALVVEAGLLEPVNTLTSEAVMPAGLMWDKTYHQAAADGLAVLNGEGFVDRDGIPILRDRATEYGRALTDGVGGTVQQVTSTEDWADVKNAIVVTSSNTDVKFDPVFLEITDSKHPAHRSKLGARRTFEFSSPLFTSRGQAEWAAPSLLARKAGPALSWQLSCMSDPSVDAGDVVEVSTGLGDVTARVRKVVHDLTSGTSMAVTLEAL